MIDPKVIEGAGGGGGGGGGNRKIVVKQTIVADTYKPVRTDDDPKLRSTSFAQLQYLLCEGEIQGPVGGRTINGLEKSVYLDDTPIRLTNNAQTTQPEDLALTLGTLNQSACPGFFNISEVTSVDTTVNNGAPVSRTITAADPTSTYSARVLLTFASLVYQNLENGDVKPTAVDYRVHYTDNASVVRTAFSGTISGKFSSNFQREHEFNLQGPGPWAITVTRNTADDSSRNNTKDSYRSVFAFSTVVSTLNQKLRYPTSSVLSLSLRADVYNSLPEVSVELQGLILEVPTNYDPVARTYAGTWDGTFKRAYSNNPAWVLRDIIINDRYGLGSYISESEIDKWSLYSIAQYCDGLVDSPSGGSEPRFTCNVILQTAEEAWTVLQQLGSIFRSIMYYGGGSIVAVQDRPLTPVFTFNESNTIEEFTEDGKVSRGNFEYAGVAKRARHTVCLVSWDDPADNYQPRVEYVADEEAIARFGYRSTDLRLIGVTSRGQALRAAQWLLLSERLLDDTVLFSTNEIGMAVRPGDYIKVADPLKVAARYGGRIVSVSGNDIVVDQVPTSAVGQTGTFSFMVNDAENQPILREVATTNITATTITVNWAAVTERPSAAFPWLLELPTLTAQPFRVLGVEESERGIYKVSALRYREDIYNAVDFDTPLNDNQSYLFTFENPTAPTITTAQVIWDNNQAKIEVEWESPVGNQVLNGFDVTVREYRLQYMAGEIQPNGTVNYDNVWKSIPNQIDNRELIPIDDLVITDAFKVRIAAIGRTGVQSDWANSEVDAITTWFPMPDLSNPANCDLDFWNQSTGGQLFTWIFTDGTLPPYISGVQLEVLPNRPLVGKELEGIRDPLPTGYYIYGEYEVEKYAVCIFHADTNWECQIRLLTFIGGLQGDTVATITVDRENDIVPPAPLDFTVVTDVPKKSTPTLRRFSWNMPTSNTVVSPGGFGPGEGFPEDDPISQLDLSNWPTGAVTDIKRFLVRFKAGISLDWDLALPIYNDGIPGDQRWFESTLFAAGTWTVLIRCLDATGWISDNEAAIAIGIGDPIPSNVVEQYSPNDTNWPGPKTNCTVYAAPEYDNTLVFCETLAGTDFLNSDCVNTANISICTDAPDYTSPEFDPGTTSLDNANITPRDLIGRKANSLLQIDPALDAFYTFVVDVPAASTNAGLIITTEGEATYQWFTRSVTGQAQEPIYTNPQGDPLYTDPQGDYFYVDASTDIAVGTHPYAEFEKIPAGQYEIIVKMKSIDGTSRSYLNTVDIKLDFPDIVEYIEDQFVSLGNERIYLTEPFHAVKSVNITVQDAPTAGQAINAKIMGKTATYVDIRTTDINGNPVDGLVDVVVSGY